MYNAPYAAMQAAVDIVSKSSHSTSKVAATLLKGDFAISCTNFWPDPILKAFGPDQDIGNSSGTVHAEVATIFKATFPTQDAELYVTDPVCPNCAKNIVEAGIKEVKIDHKGFEKSWFTNRSEEFDTLSMQIFKKAGVSVYKLWRKERRMESLYEAPAKLFVPEDSPVYTGPIVAPASPSHAVLAGLIREGQQFYQGRPFAAAIVKDGLSQYFTLIASAHAVTGYNMSLAEDVARVEAQKREKYSLQQEPVNRLMIHIARHGYQLCEGFLYASHVPTSREQVNMVGADIKTIIIGDKNKSRDPYALVAMRQLADAHIIDFK